MTSITQTASAVKTEKKQISVAAAAVKAKKYELDFANSLFDGRDEVQPMEPSAVLHAKAKESGVHPKRPDELTRIFELELVRGTGEILEDTSSTGRERPWSEHKMRNAELTKLFERAREIDNTVISDARLDALRHCGDLLYYAEDAEHERRLVRANFCHVRVCPLCNWRRSLKLYAQVSAITDAILADKKARFLFVTLTIKNIPGEELRDALNRLNRAFKNIVDGTRTLAAAKPLKKNLLGYMKAEEITYNTRRGDFHPHIHVIFEVRPSYFSGQDYLKKADWVALWRAALGVDYDPSVDVRAIKNDQREGAVAEVAKYPVKMDNVLNIKNKRAAALALIQIYGAIFRRRLVTFGGDFRTYKRKLALDDIENGDLVKTGDEKKGFNPVALVLFKWRAEVGAYIC